jgi:hypothetical protein
MDFHGLRKYIYDGLKKLFEQSETRDAIMEMHGSNDDSEYNKNKLKDKLLSIGGHTVMFGLDTEREMLRMINDGQVHKAKVFKISGQRNRCHSNVACYYKTLSPKGFKIMTGYALSDGMWIQHTWGKVDEKLIETTPIDWEIYYGYELTKEEAQDFYFDNY